MTRTSKQKDASSATEDVEQPLISHLVELRDRLLRIVLVVAVVFMALIPFSNYLFTNMLLFQLQRHSDHHEFPARRYQVLRHIDESPQLPAGYATMMVLAWFPPLWRRVMDPRVEAYYRDEPELLQQ